MLVCLGLLGLTGCGDKNAKSNFDPDSGRHPADWLPVAHSVAALAHIDTCTPCHGADFNGGISQVPCSRCHLGGPFNVHPLEWDAHGDLTYALHGGFVQQNGATACSNVFCHGANLQGVAASGPSCTSCHIGGPFSVHPVEWANQITLHGGYVLQNGTSGPPNQGCRNVTCHGPTLEGVFLSGPACNDCHNFDKPIANIPTTGGVVGKLASDALAQVRAKYAEWLAKKTQKSSP
jgi:hypothetical protein